MHGELNSVSDVSGARTTVPLTPDTHGFGAGGGSSRASTMD